MKSIQEWVGGGKLGVREPSLRELLEVHELHLDHQVPHSSAQAAMDAMASELLDAE